MTIGIDRTLPIPTFFVLHFIKNLLKIPIIYNGERLLIELNGTLLFVCKKIDMHTFISYAQNLEKLRNAMLIAYFIAQIFRQNKKSK